MMRERGMMREGGGQEAGCEYLIISHQDSGRIYSLPLQEPRHPEADRTFSCHDANINEGPQRKERT